MIPVTIPGAKESFKKVWAIGSDYFGEEKFKRIVISTAVAGAVGKTAIVAYKKWSTKKKILEKQLALYLQKEKLLKVLEDKKHESWERIVQLSFEELSSKLKKRELTAKEVLNAYQYKALQADKDVNAITEIITEADTWAAECDKIEHPSGLLHGIPVSIKDNIDIRGYDSTMGLVARLNHPAVEDSELVKLIKKHGGIPFIKTNVPQNLLAITTSNPIFGVTTNPHDKKRSPGGSSGGEAAMLASGGSIVGVGSDIGGSIRVPSHSCGTCGIKTTTGRISSATNKRLKLNSLLQAGSGPMAREVNALITMMQVFCSQEAQHIDRLLPPIPFNMEEINDKSPLRIGFYTSDGFFKAVPACERAVLEAKQRLEKLGHTVIPFEPVDPALCMHYYESGVVGDGGNAFLSKMKDEPIDRSILLQYTVLRIPVKVRRILSCLTWPFDKVFSIVFGLGSHYMKTKDFWKYMGKLEKYQLDTLEHWTNNRLDAVICPVMAGTASLAQLSITPAMCYSGMYNVLNYPAGSIPITKVTEEDEKNLEESYPTKEIFHKLLKMVCKNSVGIPVNVQVVTLPWQEEKCLRIMKELETVTRQH